MKNLFDHCVAITGNVYFASDFHLGSPNAEESRKRELLIVKWLDKIKIDATHIFLLGDIFDFWFEYHDVVPKGYYRLFAKLAELREKNIEIYLFTGNHDMWMKNYMVQELNLHLIRQETPFIINGKRCLTGHGDGLGKGDRGYKALKILFVCQCNQWLFGWLHPRIAFAIARFFSRKSRAMTAKKEEEFLGENRELLIQHALTLLQNHNVEYFIYGHRHLPIEIALTDTASYLNCGDWLIHFTYLRAGKENEKIELKRFEYLLE